MRPVHLLALTVVVASSSIAPRSWAQRALVRVSHDGPCCQSPLTGTLLAETADSLWIRPEGAGSSTPPLVLARQSVRELERGERVGAHMMVGGVAGLLAGALVGGAIGSSNACTHCDGMGAASTVLFFPGSFRERPPPPCWIGRMGGTLLNDDARSNITTVARSA